MLRWFALAMALVACDESGGDFEASSPTPTTPAKGSAGGFSADLAKSMGSGGANATGSADTTKPDTTKPDSGSAVATKPDTTKPDATKPDSGSAVATKPDTTKPDATKPDSGSAVASKPDTTKPDATKPDTTKPNTTKPDNGNTVATKPDTTKPDVSRPPDTNAPRVPVKPSAELAAIKLSLSPNWDRDVGEAGTISLDVKVPGTEKRRVFSFRYGYEDAKAPTDRDAYKKWLADNRILSITQDRQRGSTWYLEGTDGNGTPVFRIIVIYSGKKLICGGSLYKDAGSNQLGDIRDKTIVQAKEICESVAL